ncbi:MAG: M15 family metallopeptidase [Actinobacteria bacterium]|nr:M15 family metallopeptidase [Actinomycetota bacterium]NIS32167.1 M15 family metallopeptidase [Actinomycetota bacterium]NIT96112.1 M15 family metallopeptidase [Actinomycetota bacterium]NIU19791.1 M15 family metallopeptidase [Actinomycetota bacterium]NIU67228.1 M15 family metallopeptidase [Actinomycetota bacterium]
MRRPTFDEPNFTEPVEVVFGEGATLPGIEPQPDLPDLSAPVTAELTDPVDEPMVGLCHPRIRNLENYRVAGWTHAVEGTWLRASVADRLGRVADRLPADWELYVFDAWRPLELQAELFEAAYALPGTEPDFMAPASVDPATPPPHVTGGAVDLGLGWRGIPLAPGGPFDDRTANAHTDALEQQPGPARELRRFLYWSMRAEGFVVFHHEWWHFEYGTRGWAALTGCPAVFGPTAPPGFG